MSKTAAQLSKLKTMGPRIRVLKKRMSSGLPAVSLKRAQLMTESYRETEGEPVVIMRAKAVANILSKMPIGIGKQELIVGDYIEKVGKRGAPVLPEYSCDWLEQELDTLDNRDGDKLLIDERDKGTIRRLIPFWKGRTVKDRSHFLMPEELRRKYFENFEVCNNELTRTAEGLSHVVVDYDKVINEGLESVTGEYETRLKEMSPGDPVELAKIHFYRAVIITHKAIMAFAARYADLARRLEESEQRGIRKEELRKIAEICYRVPGQAATTFHEALQSFWFIQIALLIEGLGYGIAPGRMDQYLFPVYERDIREGRLNREEAKELLLCFFIKLNSLALLLPAPVSKYFAGFLMLQDIMLGGIGRDGKDATNELSYLMLEADGELSMQQPESIIRVHRDMPRDFLLKACEVARKCRGKLKFINDHVAIQKLRNQGYALEDARDYALVGCHEPFVPQKSNYVPMAHLNLAFCLELSLNNGVSFLSGKQLGLPTGDATEFISIQDVLKAYRAQVAYFGEHVAQYTNVMIEAHAQVAPTPFQSSLVQGCLDAGKDVTAGGALFNAGWLSGVGVVNVGDSLAAIKKCVFDEDRITMHQLIDALRDNFQDKDEIRQMLKEAPKFGNDDDFVDLLTKEAASIFCEEWQKQNILGGRRQPLAALNANTSGIPLGLAVGASADGRRAGEPLADGGVSPAHGRNIRGPAATYKSVAKIDHLSMKCGSVLNMRFNPDALKDERSLQKFAALLQTYFNLGGYHAQFNIVSSDMLRDAQRNSEKYRDLLVRVSTWTAYFTELSTDVQNDIIRRIEIEEV